MKVAVKDLKANPFRRMKRYPINREKVESLKTSINETSFWDNLLARQRNGSTEIAYGHHRMVALQELGAKEIDIPVRDLDDGQMIRIMANENLNDWKMTPAVYTETVLVAKEYLDGELGKCKSMDQFNENIKLIETKSQFDKLKQTGVGQTTILKFLGGAWKHKQWIIQDALNTIKEIKEKVISKTAINELPSAEHSVGFKAEVKRYNIPIKEQEGLAKKITREAVGKRGIKPLIEQHAKDTGRIPKKLPERKRVDEIPDIKVYVQEVIDGIDILEYKLIKLVGNMQHIDSKIIKKQLLIAFQSLIQAINILKQEV